MRDKTKTTISIYLNHIQNYKISAFFIIFCVIGASVVNVIVPLFFRNFFDTLASSAPKTEIAPHLILILIYIAGFEILQWSFWRGATFSVTFFESSILADLANTCFKYLHKHSFDYFSNNFVGSMVKKVNRFTRAFEDITDRVIFNLLPLFVNIVVIVGVLAVKNIWLAAGLIIWIMIFFGVNLIFIKYKLRYDLLRSKADTKIGAHLADTITNQVNVKIFCGYNRETRTFDLLNDKLRRLRRFSWDLGNYFEAAQGLLITVLEIVIFYLAIRLWQKNLLTLGDFVLIQTYIIIIFMKIWDFGRVIQRIYENLADAQEMTETLTAEHEVRNAKNAIELAVTKGEVEFNNVSFYYNDTRRILSKFNLRVASKEKVALVGSSGAGKTTIVKLLLRFYDLSGGKILIDGQKVAQATMESLWKNISLVPQDPILFHRSLMENIRYGKPEASDDEVVSAAKLAHCHEFISQLSNEYDTYVGERGIKLSGGERQRVAIARAILRNAPILILDEATSSLDSESELLIQDALTALMLNKTVIVIAHRLSTIMKMDRIIVIEDGKIVEEGKHGELLKIRQGIYKKLWKLQAGGFTD